MHRSALFYGHTMGRRKLPPGPSIPFGSIEGAETVELPIDPPWREAVRDRLKAMNQDGKSLAKLIGCSQGGISQTINTAGKRGGQRWSKHAHAISLATGVLLPPLALLHLTCMKAESSPGAAGFAKMVVGLAEQSGVRLPPSDR